MSVATFDFQEISPSGSIDSVNTVHMAVSADRESQASASCNNLYNLLSISSFTKAPVPVTEFVAGSFSALDSVMAVLAGQSADVLHVWIMINEWNPIVRKKVYAIQKEVLKRLEGLHFDFYVIDLPQGTRPEEMVSEIPVVFNRAEQDPTHSNCS